MTIIILWIILFGLEPLHHHHSSSRIPLTFVISLVYSKVPHLIPARAAFKPAEQRWHPATLRVCTTSVSQRRKKTQIRSLPVTLLGDLHANSRLRVSRVRAADILALHSLTTIRQNDRAHKLVALRRPRERLRLGVLETQTANPALGRRLEVARANLGAELGGPRLGDGQHAASRARDGLRDVGVPRGVQVRAGPVELDGDAVAAELEVLAVEGLADVAGEVNHHLGGDLALLEGQGGLLEQAVGVVCVG